MILAFCGCCLIVSIHFYVLMRLLRRDFSPCLRPVRKLFRFVVCGLCAGGLLGASQSR